ncbi:MAG: flagellar biosynthesis protein FlgB, partial [Acetobacter orientalis]
GHLSGNNGTAHAAATGGNISISGNEVKLEDQLEKVADTNDQQRLATTLYSRYTSMISTVLGSGS